MFCIKKEKKKIVIPCIPQFCYIKVGLKGVYITRTCFHDELEIYWRFLIMFSLPFCFNDSVTFIINNWIAIGWKIESLFLLLIKFLL